MTIRPFEGNELLKLADRMRAFFVGRDEVVWRAADVYAIAVQAIAAGAFAALTFDTVRQDTDSMFNIASPTRLTVKVNGWYVCSGHCVLNADAAGAGIERLIAIRVNAASVSVNNYFSMAAKLTYMSTARVIFLNSNDYVELFVLQAGALPVNTIIANYSPVLAVSRYP